MQIAILRRARFFTLLSVATALAFAGILSLATPVFAGPNDLSFPWAGGTTWQWSQGWHGEICTPDCGVDFINTNGDRSIYAMANGTVTMLEKCIHTDARPDTAWIQISHSGKIVEYAHLEANTLLVANGATVSKGQKLGYILSVGHNDGEECGVSNGMHLHLNLPQQSTIDGWTFTRGSNTATNGSNSVSPGGSFTSGNYVQPSLLSPTNDEFITDSTVDFSWTAVPGAQSYQLLTTSIVNGIPDENTYTSSTNSLTLNKGSFTNPKDIAWKVRAVYTDQSTGIWSNNRIFSYQPDRTAMVELGGAMYRSFRNNANQVITHKYYNDKWNVENSVGGTPGNVSMVVLGSNIVQSVRGNTGGRIYVRNVVNGNVWGNWTEYNVGGQVGSAISDVSMVVYNGVLYQSVVGGSQKVFTRSSTNGSTWNGMWVETSSNSVLAASEIDSAVHDSKLYQTVVDTNGKIQVRYLDGTTWSDWTEYNVNGQTVTADPRLGVSSYSLGGTFYQAMVGNSGTIYTRTMSNGIWTEWVGNLNDKSSVRVNFAEKNGALYQSARLDDGTALVRHLDAGGWQAWTNVYPNGYFQSEVNLLNSSAGSLWLQIKGLSGSSIYTVLL